MSLQPCRHLIPVVVAVWLTAATGAQAPDLRPGKYNVSIQVTIDGKSEKPQDEVDCLAPNDVKEFERWIVAKMGEECVVSNRASAGGKTTFTLTCEQGAETWRYELTSTGDSFVVRMMNEQTIDGLTLATQITARGKRTGDCDD